MVLRLIDLTEAEYEARKPSMITGFAQDMHRNFGVPLDRAEAGAAQQMAAGLPAGVSTPGQLMRKAMDGEDEVGFLWLSLPGTTFPEMAWLSEIEVAGNHRSRGYGTRIIEAGEAELAARGVHRIGLHVFGHNDGARRLYERLGYRVLSQVLSRPATAAADDTLTLAPMTRDEFAARLDRVVEHDPFALVRDPSAGPERAREFAGKLAPDGVDTEGVLLSTARVAGRTVGWIWSSLPTPDRPATGLIVHLEVEPAERRRGHGRQMIDAAAAELARRGVPRVALSVPGRPEALSFAATLGMSLMSQQMVKEI